MAGTHKLVELVGTSNISFAKAARAAVAEASKALGQLEWFEVVRWTGKIEGDQVKEFQVTLKVGCRINRSASIPDAPKGTDTKTKG
jgi:flavin-binding protein dodecin